jgi:hypothetical protein
MKKPSLFGLKNSNRNFAIAENWGKNQFNSSFPAALACYFYYKEVEAVYLELNKALGIDLGKIGISELFGLDPLGSNTFYSFETPYAPYSTLVEGDLPRIDLVTINKVNGLAQHIQGIEVKLTALPDNQTVEGENVNYGSELVVRPDTIVYLALSVARKYLSEQDALKSLLAPLNEKITDWRSSSVVRPHLKLATDVLDRILLEKIKCQVPLLMQPVWKTEGKTLVLHENCLDIFVWSDLALSRLFVDVCRGSLTREPMTRHSRSVIWVVKMLSDFADTGKIAPAAVIDQLTYDTKNDKAFAVSGNITRKYMKSEELLNPRISKKEIKNIILGGGEKLLSPERRFDAAIMSNVGLFEK